MAGIFANMKSAATLAAKRAQANAVKVADGLMSNKVVGGPIQKAVEQSRKAFAGKGLRGNLSDIAKAVKLGAETGAYDEAAKMFNRAMDALSGGTVGAAVTGAKAWFSPNREWDVWGKRMAYTAAGLFGVGSAARLLSGNGGPLHNAEGEFDIAGIPFI